MSAHFARIRDQIAEGAVSVEALEPLLKVWLEEPPPAEQPDLRCSIEVGFQTGTDADNYPVPVPEALDPDSPWFSIGFVRMLLPQNEAVVLWFAPTPALHKLRDHPRWDTGNALGFDFLLTAGSEAQQAFAFPLVREALGAFGTLTPAAIELIE